MYIACKAGMPIFGRNGRLYDRHCTYPSKLSIRISSWMDTGVQREIAMQIICNSGINKQIKKYLCIACVSLYIKGEDLLW